MKIGWKIRKLWHFEVSQIFSRKHFLTSPGMNMQMSELMMSSPHNFPFIYMCTWNFDKNYHISAHENVKTYASISKCIWVNVDIIVNSIYFGLIWGKFYYSQVCCKILRFLSKFYVYEMIWQVVRRWHHQLAHLHIHIELVKKCLPRKIMRNFKVS